MKPDWSTIASLATAGGTLVLAVATFSATRSANRSARTSERAVRIAERSLLASQRPLLVNSQIQDIKQKIAFGEGKWVVVGGNEAVLEVTDNVVYMAASVRNVGTGLAVLHGWHIRPGLRLDPDHLPLEEFTNHLRDIYIASGDLGFWQAALRDPAADEFKETVAAIEAGDTLSLSVLYGDFEGGQRVITQFTVRHWSDQQGNTRWLASSARHFNVDRPEPRDRGTGPAANPSRLPHARGRRSGSARCRSPVRGPSPRYRRREGARCTSPAPDRPSG